MPGGAGDADIATMAVGFITEPPQAEPILAEGRADMIAIGREFWPIRTGLIMPLWR